MNPDELGELWSSFQEQTRTITRIQQQRAAMSATGTAGGGRVTVTVNADGTVTKTTFADNVADLSYPELADAMTEAAQKAVEAMNEQNRELLAPFEAQRELMPKLWDLVDDIPEVPEMRAAMAAPPPLPIAPPTPERLAAIEEAATMKFTEVTQVEDNNAQRGFRNTDW